MSVSRIVPLHDSTGVDFDRALIESIKQGIDDSGHGTEINCRRTLARRLSRPNVDGRDNPRPRRSAVLSEFNSRAARVVMPGLVRWPYLGKKDSMAGVNRLAFIVVPVFSRNV